MFEYEDENENVGAEDEEVAEPQEDNEEIDETHDNDDSESEENEEVAEPQESDDDVYDKPESNKKNQTKTDEDTKYAAARRNAERQSRELMERQNNFAKQFGYNTFEELEAAQQAQKYVEQGYDEEMAQKLVKIEKYEQDLQGKINTARIAEEKSKLMDKPYFKEFENEVDAILQQNPNLNVDLVFKVVKGENIDKITQITQKAAAQKALNNINSKSHIKADGTGADVNLVTIDEEEFRIYKGLNPKGTREDYSKFLRSLKK